MRWLAPYPLWLIVLGTFLCLLAAILAGTWFARFGRRRSGDEALAGDSLGTIVGASLGLLAFILAFTFSITSNRFDDRRRAMLAEVNAIETVYLRIDLIPAEFRPRARELVREYVALRTADVSGREELDRRILRSEQIQSELWSIAANLLDVELANPDITALWIESLNEVIDFHTTRVAVAIHQGVPRIVWMALIGITLLSMVQVGYLFGRERLKWTLVSGLAFAFAVVLALIVDLDRSGSGSLGAVRFSQQPMIDMQERIAPP